MPHTVLIVDPDLKTLARTGKILSEAGYLVMLASSFEQARQRSSLARPSLLITDVRLGAYNGLHLVIRSRDELPEMPAIVTHDVADSWLEREATHHHASYLVKPFSPEKLLELVATLLRERPVRTSMVVARRWRRKTAGEGFVARLGGSRATLIDLSYGGVCLEVAEPDARRLATLQEMRFPTAGVSLRGRAVWTRPAGAAGRWWCGVELDQTDAAARQVWRRFVDRLN